MIKYRIKHNHCGLSRTSFLSCCNDGSPEGFTYDEALAKVAQRASHLPDRGYDSIERIGAPRYKLVCGYSCYGETFQSTFMACRESMTWSEVSEAWCRAAVPLSSGGNSGLIYSVVEVHE